MDTPMNITQIIEQIDCESNIVTDSNNNTNRKRKRKLEETTINEILENELPAKRCKTYLRLHDEQIIDNIIEDEEYKNILINVAKLYHKKDAKITEKFNKTLLLLSKYQDSKEKDLKFRKAAKQLIRTNWENIDIDDWQVYKSVFKDQDIGMLMEELVINLRNHHYTLKYSDDYRSEHSAYVEIAVKSNNAHKEYKKIMNELFENIFSNNISTIICEYSRNSYIWYSIDVDYCYSNTDKNYYDFYMYNVPFSLYDHYDGKYNKRSDRITITQLKNDLDIRELNEMNSLEISYFITAIGNVVLELENDDVHALGKKFSQYHNR